MRASVEQTWFAQRRALAAGFLTGVALIASVVLSRRVAGDASGFSSQFWACCVGLIGMAVSAFSSTVPGILGELTRVQRCLAAAFSSLPGLVLGLALLPSGSGTGLAALLALFGLTLGVSTFFSDSIGERKLSPALNVRGRQVGNSVTRDAVSLAEHESEFRNLTAETKSFVIQPCDSEPCLSATMPIDSELEAELNERLGLAHVLPSTALFDAEIGDDTHDESDFDIANDESAAALPHPAENPNTTHWLARTIDADSERLEGVVTVELTALERQVVVHIPFVPAFEVVPEFECEPIHGEPVEVSVTQIKTYGARLEVRRPKTEMQSPLSVQVGYFASCEIQQCTSAKPPKPSIGARNRFWQIPMR